MPTFQQYRRPVQQALDDVVDQTLGVSSSSTAVATGLINTTASASTERFNGAYIYVTSGIQVGVQRGIKPGSYVAASGTLGVYPDWTAPAAGSHAEITRLFPSGAWLYDGTTYLDIINNSIKKLLSPNRRVTATAASQTLALGTTYTAWLTDPDRIAAVYEPPRALGWPRPLTWRRWTVKIDSTVTTIQFVDTVPDGMVFEVELRQPAFYFINGLDSVVGLAAESDVAYVAAEDVKTAALAEAYQALSQRTSSAPVDPDAAKKAAYWLGEARKLASWDRWRERRDPTMAAPQATAEAA